MSEFDLQPCDGRHLIQKLSDELLKALAQAKQKSCNELAQILTEFGIEDVKPCDLVSERFLRLIANNQTDEAINLLLSGLRLPPHTLKLLLQGFDNLTPQEQQDVVLFVESSGASLPPYIARVVAADGGIESGLNQLSQQERSEFNQWFEDRGTTYTVSFLTPLITTQISQKVKCPTGQTLQRLINIIRTVKKFINGIATRLQTLSRIVNIISAAINAISLTLDALKASARAAEVAALASAATPSGASGIFALAVSKLNRLADQIRPDIQGPSNRYGETGLDGIVCQAAKTITYASIQVNTIQVIINIIDTLLQSCSKDQIDTGSFTVVELSQSANNSASLGIYQGYRLEIRVDPNSPPVAPRRYAVAIDSVGVVVLEGNRSFSSSNELLIEELKLAIDRLVN